MLREFSQRMIARTHEMEKEVDGLVHEAKVMEWEITAVVSLFVC